jgi:hypothetical protein
MGKGPFTKYVYKFFTLFGHPPSRRLVVDTNGQITTPPDYVDNATHNIPSRIAGRNVIHELVIEMHI